MTWVGKVRQLLAAAQPPRHPDLEALQAGVEGALARVPGLRLDDRHARSYPIRRRQLICHVARQARYFGLGDEVMGFCLAADCTSPGGLELAELEALAHWLDQLVAQQLDACDSDLAPPAR